MLQTETVFGLLKQKMNVWQEYLSAHRTNRMSGELGSENENTQGCLYKHKMIQAFSTAAEPRTLCQMLP